MVVGNFDVTHMEDAEPVGALAAVRHEQGARTDVGEALPTGVVNGRVEPGGHDCQLAPVPREGMRMPQRPTIASPPRPHSATVHAGQPLFPASRTP